MPDRPVRELTADEVEAFHSDGALCARGLFPMEWVERMARAVDSAVAMPTPYGDQVSIPEQGFRGDLFLWKTWDAFRDFIYDSPAAWIAQQLLDSKRVNFFYDQLFVKPPGCHVPTPWHQDVSFWPIQGEQVCSIWMTFDPIDHDSSGLEFVRGSNGWPQRFKAITPDYNAYMMDSELEDPPDIDADRGAYDLISWDMEPGDVVLFDGLVVHGSSGNHTTDRPRRAFSTRWTGDDVRFAPRHATMPLLWRHDLATGQPLCGPLFPQILPETIPGEEDRRAEGPEAPDPEMVKLAVAAIARAAEAQRDA